MDYGRILPCIQDTVLQNGAISDGENMKRIIYYIAVMLCILIVLPLLIVRSCDMSPEAVRPGGAPKGLKIKVYMHQQKVVKEMDLEEYLYGVVAAEMPAEFEPEALKAQAVAARTYALGRYYGLYVPREDTHQGAAVCTDFAHCQAWVGKQDAMKKWKVYLAAKYWSKIVQAVKETRGVVITYNGKLINPLFHSNSGGRTENSEEVWSGTAEPYLRSVYSDGEEVSPEYKSVTLVGVKDFFSVLKKQYPNFKADQKHPLKEIKVLNYTTGGRIKDLQIGNITLKGTEFRSLFSLRSANFSISQENTETLKITVLGNGHGAGMSQWGANAMARNGALYGEILKYYYTGVELTTLDKLQALAPVQ